MNKIKEQPVNTLSSRVLWRKLRASRAYRKAFATAQFKRLVPFQIGALRRGRGWSQQELAEACGLTQGVISRAEDPDYGNLTVNTILKIAEGFDIAFVGRFVPFSNLETLVNTLSNRESIPTFEQEDAQGRRIVPEVLDDELAASEDHQDPIPIEQVLAGRGQGRTATMPIDLGSEQIKGGLMYAAVGGSSSQSVSLR